MALFSFVMVWSTGQRDIYIAATRRKIEQERKYQIRQYSEAIVGEITVHKTGTLRVNDV